MTIVRRTRTLWLHLAALWALAVAQPLFDLLGRNPEFFVAHQAGRTEIFIVVLGVVLLPPAVLVGLVGLARLAGKHAQSAVLGVVIAALVGMFAMQVAKHAGAHTWPVAIPFAVGAGLAAAVVYLRAASGRRFVTLLSLGVVIFPVLLLARPQIRRLWNPPEDHSDRLAEQAEGEIKPADAAPIVLVVLDETPLLSWLDADDKIDPVLYPNFATLARDGTWFRNATAVSDYTRWALPPIVSGMYPRADASPTVADYPNNLFTLLARTHRLEVVEGITELCPARLCRPPTDPLSTRLMVLANDLRYAYLHVVLTDDLTHGLPSLTARWADFGDLGKERRQRIAAQGRGRSAREVAANFIEWISADDPQPTFYFLHSILTHFPHRALPTGQINRTRAAVPGQVGPEGWNDDAWGLAQNYQRHLLEVAYSDRMVGRLIARLKRPRPVPAGHRHRHGGPRHLVHAGHATARLHRPTAANIVRVPLIIKLPEDRSGLPGPVTIMDGERVSDRNVETIDIAPTVADALGIKLPWHADGISLLDPSLPERPSKKFFYQSAEQVRTFDAQGTGHRGLNCSGRSPSSAVPTTSTACPDRPGSRSSSAVRSAGFASRTVGAPSRWTTSTRSTDVHTRAILGGVRRGRSPGGSQLRRIADLRRGRGERHRAGRHADMEHRAPRVARDAAARRVARRQERRRGVRGGGRHARAGSQAHDLRARRQVAPGVTQAAAFPWSPRRTGRSRIPIANAAAVHATGHAERAVGRDARAHEEGDARAGEPADRGGERERAGAAARLGTARAATACTSRSSRRRGPARTGPP